VVSEANRIVREKPRLMLFVRETQGHRIYERLDSGPVFQRGKPKTAGMTESGDVQSGKTFGNRYKSGLLSIYP
jgi:hypothetical protein